MTVSAASISSGVPGLDIILGGGLSRNAMVFIVGPPGAGKTILGSQIVFEAVRRGEKALIMTAFSEGHVKLIEHLRPFPFFDEAQVGQAVTILALQTLLDSTPGSGATTLVRTIRESGARLVLLDGFQGAADLVGDPRALRQMLASLSSLLSYVDVTLVITLEGNGWEPTLMSELTTADVALGLDYRVDGLRHSRHVEVIKQRGQAPLPGLHPYAIAEQGLTVFPRLEARPLLPARPRLQARAPFGLPELDALLGGGLSTRTTTLLAGAPGAGKTILALHWALEEARPERRTVFFSFAEHEEDLREKALAFGMDLGPALASGALIVIRMSPAEIVPDIFATRLLDALTPATGRLVIDDIAGLVRALGDRAPDYLAALNDQLYARAMTSLILHEIDAFTGFGIELARSPLSSVAHNVLVMQQVATDGMVRRMMAVLKMRFGEYDRTVRELVLDERGVRVLPASETPDKPAPVASGGET